MSTPSMQEPQAQTRCGVNHLVLNVRDIEVSHRFWTEVLGFRHVGTWRAAAPGATPARFYSGVRDGKLHHHDIALVEVGDCHRRRSSHSCARVGFIHPPSVHESPVVAHHEFDEGRGIAPRLAEADATHESSALGVSH